MNKKSIFKDGANKNLTHPITKQGISLIVLVITIIVMIILAATVIITLANNKIIGKANDTVKLTNLKQVQTLAQVIWAEGYLNGEDSTTIKNNIIAAIGGENLAKDYDINVNKNGVTVTLKGDGGEQEPPISRGEDSVPTEWQAYVSQVTSEGVPIPKGFMLSPFEDEDEIAEGLVIYEIDGTETANPSSENQHTWQISKNQYVWIPVDKTTFGTANTEFKRQNFGLGFSINTDAELGTDYWEIVPSTDETTTNNKKYLVAGKTLLEVQAMYESVEEYGGFYIARYEAGIGDTIDAQRTSKGYSTTLPLGHENVHSKMGQIPYAYIPWTWEDPWGTGMEKESQGAVEVARSIYPNDNTNTTGVISTLTYGVQWDRTVEWLRVNGKDINGNSITSITNTIAYGNYQTHEIKKGDLNLDAMYAVYEGTIGEYEYVTYTEGVSNEEKDLEADWALSTGALKAAKINNIYDLAGNMWEWTMEGNSSDKRVERGGSFVNDNSDLSISYRFTNGPEVDNYTTGFRIALYIKK